MSIYQQVLCLQDQQGNLLVDKHHHHQCQQHYDQPFRRYNLRGSRYDYL